LVPEYLESSWCLAEWRAMEKLEQERLTNSASDGFIIPVLFRGDRDRFTELCGDRQFIDFRHIAKPRSQLDSIKCRRDIEQIARRVAELAKSQSHTDCGSFLIESDKEVVSPALDDPNPLA
jgi:hypothetical protein